MGNMYKACSKCKNVFDVKEFESGAFICPTCREKIKKKKEEKNAK